MSLKLEFNPSSSNYLDWFLLTNDSIDKSQSNGYFVRVGDVEDDVSLWRKQNQELTKIIDGLNDRVDVNPVDIRIKAERLYGGNWSLWVDVLDGNGWVLEGTVQDHEINLAKFSGLLCKYTSTRCDKFYFDDFFIDGDVYLDTVAPKLKSHSINGSNEILLSYDCSDFLDINSSMFHLITQNSSPYNCLVNGANIVLLFENTFPVNEPFELYVSGLSDTAGNSLPDTTINLYLQKHAPFDVIINEVMVDPEPSVQLPVVEYVELYNRKNYPVKLINWTLLVGDQAVVLDSISLEGHEHLVLFNSVYSSIFEAQNFHGASLPNLNNEEEYLGLFDEDHQLIHEIHYDRSWYHNDNKSNGGWSMEMIDPENYCSGINNWKSCKNNLGGSPGNTNSVFDQNLDLLPPVITDVFVEEEDKIELIWSENLYDSTLLFFNSYSFSNGLNLLSIDHQMNKTYLTFFNSIDKGVLFKLSVLPIKDCQENSSDLIHYEFANGKWPDTSSLYINEILFNATTDGYEYVELYNATEEYIDLSKVLIGNYDPFINDIIDTERVTQQRHNLSPHSYISLCEDTSWIKKAYPSKDNLFFLEVDRLPSLPNDEGTIAISSLAFELIDVFSYSEELHSPLLNDLKGVALERVHHESNHWFSASSSENYGTPSRQNSQFSFMPQYESKLDVIPEVFSPNNDGYHDFTNIKIHVDLPSKVNIYVYDKKGFKVRELCKSELVTKEATWLWDGTNNEGLELPIGIYMMIASLIESSGSEEIIRHPIVISR